MKRRFALCLPLVAAILGLSGCSDSAPEEGVTEVAVAQDTVDQLARLGIEIAEAKSASGLPIASVPGVITLPPEARVAVTSVFPGTVVKNYVIEGQFVRRGQPLALVQAGETIKTRGNLARAESQVELAQARAKRLNLLAEEGIIAGARAD